MKTISILWFIILGAFSDGLQQGVTRHFNKVNVFEMVDGKPIHKGSDKLNVEVTKGAYMIGVKVEGEEEANFMIKERIDSGVFLVENINGMEWIFIYIEDVIQMSNGVLGYQFVYEKDNN